MNLWKMEGKQHKGGQPSIQSRAKSTVGEAQDYTIKVIIIGDSGVGKTNIVSRYCSPEGAYTFRKCHVPTIGVDFHSKVLQLQERRLKMQIWDTAGQQRFKTITQTYYKGTAGIILVYSVQSPQSFNSMERWIEQVNAKTSENVVKVLVANKIDIEEDQMDNDFCSEQARKISSARGRALANRFNLEYYETSAKSNEGIAEMFEQLANKIKATIQGLKLVKNEAQEVQMTLTLNSQFMRSTKKVRRQGVEYRVGSQKHIIQKLKSKCTC